MKNNLFSQMREVILGSDSCRRITAILSVAVMTLSAVNGFAAGTSSLKNTDVAISEKNITISTTDSQKSPEENSVVNGVVLDNKGEAMIGVTVIIVGTNQGTVTNIDGEFSIEADPNALLRVQFLGYKTTDVLAQHGSPMSIVLEDDSQNIEEVVVVGYGTQKKVNLTGSVTALGSEDLDGIPASNVTSMLQGKLPGVQITQTTGLPGRENTSIRIRGVGTMNNSSPMILVDGIEGSLDDLNPNDIESISVLKDAASASIYGTRAANGVILVTTKRGAISRPTVSYNGYVGFQESVNLPEYVDSWDYATLLNESTRNAGGSIMPYTDEDIQKFKNGTSPDTHPNTDWQSELLKGRGLMHSHNMALRGGAEYSRYSISLGYYNQEGLTERTNFERYNVRTNYDAEISEKLKFGISTSLSYGQIEMPSSGDVTAAGKVTNLDGLFKAINTLSSATVNQFTDGSYYCTSAHNPIVLAKYGGLTTRDKANVSGNTYLQYEIIKDLTIRGIAAVDYYKVDDLVHFNTFDYYNDITLGRNSVSNKVSSGLNITLQAFLNYSKTFANHNIKGMFGVSRESNDNKFISAYRHDMANGLLTDVAAGSTTGWTNDGGTGAQRIGSYLGRLNYDYKGIYLFEANFRTDGSSKFARGYRWATFPSFSAGWRVSEEKFMEGSRDWLDNLKVRASWGKLGNHRISDYAYMGLISFNPSFNYMFGDQLVAGAAQNSAFNPIISWETTTESNFGVDFSAKNGMFVASLDLYNRYTDDILTSVAVSNLYGLPAPLTNSGAMSNKGVELTLGFNKNNGDFTYGIYGNVAYNKNNTEVFGEPSKSSDPFIRTIKKEGLPWTSYWGYECIGKFTSLDDLESYPAVSDAVKVGDLKFKDQNGDGKITTDDEIYLGNMVPDISYVFNLNAGYKGMDLLVSFQGVSGAKRGFNTALFWPMQKDANSIVSHLDRTIVENDVIVQEGFYPRIGPSSDAHNRLCSSFSILDASYLRLKNVQIGYTAPANALSSVGISSARVYLSGQNLLTFDKLPDGFDPEMSSFGGVNYPQVAMFTLGLDLIF